jgi:hypothetical protein
MLAANRAFAHLVSGAESALLSPPVNVLRLCLHPAGLAPRIVNLAQWRAHVIARLRRQIDASGDGVLIDLLEEIRDYPSPRGTGPGSIEHEEDPVVPWHHHAVRHADRHHVVGTDDRGIPAGGFPHCRDHARGGPARPADAARAAGATAARHGLRALIRRAPRAAGG